MAESHIAITQKNFYTEIRKAKIDQISNQLSVNW